MGFDDDAGLGVGVLVGNFFMVGTFLGSVGEGTSVGVRKTVGVGVGVACSPFLPKTIDPPPKRRIMPSTAPPIKIIWF